MLRRQGPILGATFSQNLAILFLPNPADISIHTDEGDPTEEGAVVGGQDGGAEGQEGDHDAVQHHPRQQEPRKRKKRSSTGFGKRMTHRKWIRGQQWLHWLVLPSAALFSISSREFS